MELQLVDAVDRSRWKTKIVGYWCDSNSYGDGDGCKLQIYI